MTAVPPSAAPPPDVAAAAATVQRWLDAQPNAPKKDDDIKKMSPAERLNYVRSFDQTKMPANTFDGRFR